MSDLMFQRHSEHSTKSPIFIFTICLQIRNCQLMLVISRCKETNRDHKTGERHNLSIGLTCPVAALGGRSALAVSAHPLGPARTDAAPVLFFAAGLIEPSVPSSSPTRGVWYIEACLPYTERKIAVPSLDSLLSNLARGLVACVLTVAGLSGLLLS